MAVNAERMRADGKDDRCRILVAGVGGGACSMLERTLEHWPNPPEVAAVNTDARALAECHMELKVMIGRTVTKGMGAGADAELGRLAANEDLDALRTLVANYDLLLLVAGLGGGTGTGAAPILARMAREEGLLTLAYVTTPFEFEGIRRQEQAQAGLTALKAHADTVICLPNQRLHAMLPEGTPLMEAFSFVDRMMAAGIRGLWTLIARDNMLNLDFSDVQSLVENSGNECCFGYGEGEGVGKAEEALQTLLEGPMLEKGRVIANSGAMILNVAGGPDLSLSELERIHRRFKEVARPGARISMGAAVLPDWEGRLALTVLAAEHWMPSPRNEAAPEKRRDTLFDDAKIPSEERARRSRRGGRQSELPLAALPSERGRFQNVAPTIYNGEDLDIPTYMRHGVRIPT
ncbi:MAG: cell division FtsZ family protein [Verrucomicrobiota bacterium]|jgi:cell division protein FtsZ|nr:cell division FtsZ family protein [Verrucomicrobiota bacterium]